MEILPGWVLLIIGAGGITIIKWFGGLIVKVFSKKYGIKDKDSDEIATIKKNCVDKHKKTDQQIVGLVGAAKKSDKAQSVILITLRALLVTARDGKPNGEIKKALELFDENFEKEYCIKQ